MKFHSLIPLLLLAPLSVQAGEATVTSPGGKLSVTVSDQGGRATYAVSLDGQQVLQPSALGFKADFGDFTQGLSITNTKEGKAEDSYVMRQVKQSHISYQASTLSIDFENQQRQKMSVEFFVKDNDVAFRYVIPRQAKDNPKTATILSESTAFRLPDGTTTFLCPQIDPMKGWERTKPSYEEEYKPDAPMTDRSQFGQGYTFPCLFKAPGSWVLISETGVDSHYCGSHLSDYQPSAGYTIAYPQPGENNGFGSPFASIALPGQTPWRTITVGQSLAPIVETTIPYDVVRPLYEPSQAYKGGRYTWSWLIWQDESINYADQVQFIDLAAAMGYEYCLVDNWWDKNIGRDRMAELSKYAQQKGVSLLLWYNSNGHWNDAPQTPRNCMDTNIARDREMAWLKQIGVKGIKVDFFAGDKQETMKLYEDILYDANRYGLQVVFHGCTIPRGWERMYPNYVSSEAVLASENVFFSEYHAGQEPFQLTMHPFCRNAVGTMDWGGVIMNKYLSRDNKSRHSRKTTDVFELATAFTNQAALQCVAMQPNNLQERPDVELTFLQNLPTTWDETRYIDGYPGRYVVLARRQADRWYVAALNGTKEPLKLTLDLSHFAGLSNQLVDRTDKKTQKAIVAQTPLKVDKKGRATIELQPNGGTVLF
ncbi:MAG: glycoside hydrolase family 97 catalytic domain-containing protein [Prevotella sp.]|nr:glycoside hydrolase family 97 catalytic domain-containing protein [Prevotella sp.]